MASLSTKQIAEKILRKQLTDLDRRSGEQVFDLKDAELLQKLVDTLISLQKPATVGKKPGTKLRGATLDVEELERYAMPDDEA